MANQGALTKAKKYDCRNDTPDRRSQPTTANEGTGRRANSLAERASANARLPQPTANEGNARNNSATRTSATGVRPRRRPTLAMTGWL
jgi:hypothetical protein